MPPELSRNALLVKYFTQVYRGIPRKHLVKLIYEADVLGREYLARPLSTFTYKKDKYGPYDPAIKEAVSELVGAGHVEEKRDSWFGGEGAEGAYLRLYDQRRPVAFNFSLGESAVLDYVVTNYIKMPFEEFLYGVVYETLPMKAAGPRGSRLPMELADGVGTRKVGFHLEEVLKAEEAGRQGEFITLSEFVAELRAQAPT